MAGRFSRRHGPWLALLGLVWLLSAECQAQYWVYTVRPGDNLWTISERYLASMGYWRPLQELNDVSQPRRMPPGSSIRVPIRWLKVQPAAASVADLQGAGEKTDGLSGQRMALQAGMALRAGDVVTTGPGSSAVVEFADGSRFLMQEETRLRFDTVSEYGTSGMIDARMRLQEGRLDVRTAPGRAPGTRFEILTPAAIAAVRGTEYRVAMEPERATALTEVLGGEVAVTGRGSTLTRHVPAGFGTITVTGQPPAPPVPLLPPPDLSVLPEVHDRVPLQFGLAPLAGAAAHRLQIAVDTEFKAPLFDRTARALGLSGPDLPDGHYLVRVRGIDQGGLEGSDATRRFEIDARPEPPLLMTPDEGSTVREPLPRFQWTEPQEARAYHFQLTPSDFGTPTHDLREHDSTGFTPSDELPPGTYHWRVATVSGAGEHGPFSDPQTFVLRPAPEGPEVDEPEIDEATMVFRWRAGLSGQRYQIQVASDGGFENVVIDRTVEQPRLEIPRPTPGRYYLRVRTIDVDGYVGKYGQRQTVDVPPTSYWPYAVVPLFALVLLL